MSDFDLQIIPQPDRCYANFIFLPSSIYFDAAIYFEIVSHTKNKEEGGSALVCDGKLASVGFLLSVSVRVWHDEGFPACSDEFSPHVAEKKPFNFWWKSTSLPVNSVNNNIIKRHKKLE